jgi:mRNA-degrading endonuclease toxin of MazEF toxin-antitoxin module
VPVRRSIHTTVLSASHLDERPAGQLPPPVLVEQTTVVDPQRLDRSAGRLDASELRAVD